MSTIEGTRKSVKTARHMFHDFHVDAMEAVTMAGLMNLMYSLECLGMRPNSLSMFCGMFRWFSYRSWMVLIGGLLAAQIIALLLGLRHVRKGLCFAISCVLAWIGYLIYQRSTVGIIWRYEVIFSVIAIIAFVRLSRRIRLR